MSAEVDPYSTNSTHPSTQENGADYVKYGNPTDRLMHFRVTEGEAAVDISSRWIIDQARRAHAEGYSQAHYLDDSAVVNGYVVREIDHATGPRVTYCLGVNPLNPLEKATMRLVDTEKPGDYTTLPTFPLCRNALSPDGIAYLEHLKERGVRIREVAALASSKHGDPQDVREVIRSVIHDVIRSRSDEQWVFNMVKGPLGSYITQFGERNFKMLGTAVRIADSRVNGSAVELLTAALDPAHFVENIYLSYAEASNERRKSMLARSFVYMSEGLPDEFMTQDMVLARRELVAAGLGRSATREMPHVQELSPVEEILHRPARGDRAWSLPVMLQLGSELDQRRLASLDREMMWGLATTEGSEKNLRAYIEDLFALQPSARQGDAEARARFVEETLGEDPDRYGKWAVFPWSRELAHYPPVEVLRAVHTARNRNLVDTDEQQHLYDMTVGVFGLSVGHAILSQLLMGGIGGRYVLGDPDTLSPTNLNRLPGSINDVGKGKLSQAAIEVSERDPYIEQVHLREGVTREALEALSEHERPQIIVDAVDDLRAKAVLRAYAKKYHIPLIMVTDFGYTTIVDVERYDLDEDTQPFLGMLDDEQLQLLLGDDPLSPAIDMAIKQRLFRNELASEGRLVESLQALNDGTLVGGLSQLGSTAAVGGGAGAEAIRSILLGRGASTGRYRISIREAMGLVPLPSAHVTRNAI